MSHYIKLILDMFSFMVQGTTPIQCSFEKVECSLQYNSMPSDSGILKPWERKMANWSSSSVKPSVDSTFASRKLKPE